MPILSLKKFFLDQYVPLCIGWFENSHGWESNSQKRFKVSKPQEVLPNRSQLIQNSNWKFHPLQICITSQFLNLHHWQPNRTAADKKYSVWILLTEYHEHRGITIIVTHCCPKVYNSRLCTREWQEQGLCICFTPFWFFSSVLHPDIFFFNEWTTSLYHIRLELELK